MKILLHEKKTIFLKNIDRVKLQAELYSVKQTSYESARDFILRKEKNLQTLGIQQSNEEAIQIIVDRMLADVQDRIDIVESKMLNKLYEIGVKFYTRHPLKQFPEGNWRNRELKFISRFKITIGHTKKTRLIAIMIEDTPYKAVSK